MSKQGYVFMGLVEMFARLIIMLIIAGIPYKLEYIDYTGYAIFFIILAFWFMFGLRNDFKIIKLEKEILQLKQSSGSLDNGNN